MGAGAKPMERPLGGDGRRVPTHVFDGYGAFVSHLYAGLAGERLFI
jgi:hypothetical protein